MVVKLIAMITQQLINFLIPEFLFLFFVETSKSKLKIRFTFVEENPRLKRFANIWTVGAIALLMYLLSPLIFQLILGEPMNEWLVSLGLLKLLSLTISLIGFTLIFIVNYLFAKEMDKSSLIIAVISILSFIVFMS